MKFFTFLGRLLLVNLYSLSAHLVPKDKSNIVCISYPDCSDSTFAYFQWAMSLPNRKNKKFIFLVKNPLLATQEIQKVCGSDGVNEYVVLRKNTVFALWIFLRSKVVLYTHGTYWFVRCAPGQIYVNLWHGMPIKRIGLMDGKSRDEMQYTKYVVSTSDFYSSIMANCFGVSKSQVWPIGLPRNDWLLSLPATSYDGVDVTSKYIVWMPTYKKSREGEIRQDSRSLNDFPAFMCKADLLIIDSELEMIDCRLIIKLHPMDVLNDCVFDDYKNIDVISSVHGSNPPLFNTYALLKNSQALITDFSSVAVDYLLLNKPLALVVVDVEEYSRGFIPGVIELFSNAVKIGNRNDFLKFLVQSMLVVERESVSINNSLHYYCSGLSSERLDGLIESLIS